jgi:hypothetical protein
MGSTRPVRRFDAPRAHLDATSRTTEAVRGPSLRFPAPSEASVAAPHGPAGPWADTSNHATSPGLCRPYDTFSARWRVTTAVPPAAQPATCGGLATSCAATPSHLPAREAPERPWAFPFRASSPCAAVPPLGGPALLSLPALAPHREVHTRTRSASGLSSRHGLVRSPTLADRPSRPSWGSPLQSVLPIRPGTALWSRGLPSHPPHELTSQLGRVTGSCEANGSAWSVSGLPALLGFVTS